MTSFWLQPVDPLPVPDTASFDSGLHHAGETVRPPPVTTTFRELDLGRLSKFSDGREGVSHPAPLPPPSAAGRAGVGAGAPPSAADPCSFNRWK